MLSCLVDTMPQSLNNYDWSSSSSVKSTLPAVRLKCLDGYKISASRIYPAAKETPVVDKSSFLKGFGLVPAQPSDEQKLPSKQSSVDVDYNVIVIEDDDDDDDQIFYQQDDVFGMKCSMNGGQSRDQEAGGSNTSRSVQPGSRVRKLMSIEISSPLGLRMLGYVTSMLKNDGTVLNPLTVSHSLSGSEVSLDYGTFCRTPVKGSFSGRLRQRGFPVKFRRSPYADTHYHYYCFGRSDRQKFCRRFDTGLSGRSRRLRDKCGRCAVVVEKLSADEVVDWRTSPRLLDYVRKMQQKEANNALSSQNDSSDAVICLSSDSEDEALPVGTPQDLVFRCHQCDVKLPCTGSFRTLVRDHYSSCHGIFNIDIIHIPQPDGTTAMQIVHVPTTLSPIVNAAAYSLQNSVTGTPFSGQSFSSQCLDANKLYISQPDVRVPRVGNLVNGLWVPVSLHGVNGSPVPRQLFSNNYASGDPGSDMLTPLSVSMSPPSSGSGPMQPFRRKFSANPAILRRSLLCGGDAVSGATVARSSSDTDVICLD